MRNLFLLLLLANICVGMWVYSEEKAAREAVKPKQPNAAVETLVLLSELTEEPKKPELPAPVAPQSLVEEVAPEPVEVAEPEIEETPEPEVSNELVMAVPESEPSEPVVEPEPVALECFTIGPFSSSTRSKRAVRLLSAAGAEVSKRTSVEQVPYGYRVFIPPLSSKEKAYTVASELRDKGVKDYFVITNPNDKLNGISLGLFSQKTGAIKRVAKLRNLNYQANIEVRYKDKEIYWVDYGAEEGVINSQILREASEGVEEIIQYLPRDCG